MVDSKRIFQRKWVMTSAFLSYVSSSIFDVFSICCILSAWSAVGIPNLRNAQRAYALDTMAMIDQLTLSIVFRNSFSRSKSIAIRQVASIGSKPSVSQRCSSSRWSPSYYHPPCDFEAELVWAFRFQICFCNWILLYRAQNVLSSNAAWQLTHISRPPQMTSCVVLAHSMVHAVGIIW